MSELVPNALYVIKHRHDGEALVRLISVDKIFARVEMVDPRQSTFQLPAGHVFRVVIKHCKKFEKAG